MAAGGEISGGGEVGAVAGFGGLAGQAIISAKIASARRTAFRTVVRKRTASGSCVRYVAEHAPIITIDNTAAAG